MRDPKAEAARWLAQAENDLAFARYALEGGYFHQACFVAQQAAEKAMKGLLMWHDVPFRKTHDLA